jgi:hypothetical protein
VCCLADNDTVVVSLTRLPEDVALQALRFPDVFDAAAAAVPPFAPWVDPELTVPISPVTAMGGIRNTIHLPLTRGRPRLLGLHAVGDALATSVPMPVAVSAAAVDAEVWVRLARAMQVLDPPQTVFDDPALAARITELDPPPLPAPARRETLLDAIDVRSTLTGRLRRARRAPSRAPAGSVDGWRR